VVHDNDDLELGGRNFSVSSILPTGRYVLLVEEAEPTGRAGFLTFYVGDPVEAGDLDASGGGSGSGDDDDAGNGNGNGDGNGTGEDPDPDDLCAEGRVFDEDSGTCVPEPADTCAAGRTYDAGTGTCVPDPADTCPEGRVYD